MNTTDKARGIVRQAELALRSVIEESARKGEYATVAELATMADALGRMLKPTDATSVNANPGEGLVIESPDRRAGRGGVRIGEYPRFVRQGDRLVKVGWSKKRGAAYEHKVPFDVVERIAQVIGGSTKANRVFTVEAILPNLPSSGLGDIPPYQTYVVIAWLRKLGVLTKEGRDGYAWKVDPSQATAAAWRELAKG